MNVYIIYVLCLVSTHVEAQEEYMEPGQCLSRFDYDHKVMQKILELESSVQEFKAQSKSDQVRSNVAFMATLSQNIENPRPGTTVVFDSVMTNIGQAYNSATGVFVASIRGTYNFQYTITSPRKTASTYLHLSLMRNDQMIGYIFVDNNDKLYLLRSTNAVVYLNAGDHVFVKFVQASTDAELSGGGIHTHFNGFLLQEDL